MKWIRWYRHIELALIALVLVVLGATHFSRITEEERRAIELEAGLEQLYQLERAYFAAYGRYFDPVDPAEGLGWEWTKNYEWEIWIGRKSFSIQVRADLDRDGIQGVWSIDERSPLVRMAVGD